jgi:hypothetical protein
MSVGLYVVSNAVSTPYDVYCLMKLERNVACSDSARTGDELLVAHFMVRPRVSPGKNGEHDKTLQVV